MHLGSVYLIVRDFNKSVIFYEKLLEMKVTSKNMERFAQFEFEGHNISIMNGYFDNQNPELTIHKVQYVEKFDNLVAIAETKNTNKFVLNFWVEDLEKEGLAMGAQNSYEAICLAARKALVELKGKK